MVLLALVVLLVYTVVVTARASRERRRAAHARWHVVPLTTDDYQDQIWLECAGEDPYLVWPKQGDQRSEDEAMIDAELKCREFNRLRKQLPA